MYSTSILDPRGTHTHTLAARSLFCVLSCKRAHYSRNFLFYHSPLIIITICTAHTYCGDNPGRRQNTKVQKRYRTNTTQRSTAKKKHILIWCWRNIARLQVVRCCDSACRPLRMQTPNDLIGWQQYRIVWESFHYILYNKLIGLDRVSGLTWIWCDENENEKLWKKIHYSISRRE